MQSIHRPLFSVGAALLSLARTVNAQQPPDPNPSSDGFGNSAYGQNALLDLKNPNGGSSVHDPETVGEYTAPESTGYVAAFNTAVGSGALQATTVGSYNSGFGYQALFQNTLGIQNTAVGAGSLYANSAGNDNTAVGQNALGKNTSASDNTATGFSALAANTTGNYNTASGFQALLNNNGSDNTAFGYDALYTNRGGNYNTATGMLALYSNTGSENLGLGYHGGYNLTTGSYNIDIGNPGVAAESGIIRIGTTGTQTAAYIAGIESSQVTGAAVYVTASGQLGVLASSERYKTAITPLRTSTDQLERLRPVSFHLKSDPQGTVQYGLIAEEVEKIYPELVIHDAAGRVQGVRYDELAPMLLNEVQRQRRQMTTEVEKVAAQARSIESQERIIKAQAEQLAEVGARVTELNRQMAEVRQYAAVSLNAVFSDVHPTAP